MKDSRRNEKRKRKSENRGRPEGTPSGVHSALFWMLLILMIPFSVYFFQAREKQATHTLKQSEFERALLERRVSKVVIKIDSANGKTTAEGEMLGRGNAQSGPFVTDLVLNDQLIQLIRDNCSDWQTIHVNNFWNSLLISIIPVIIVIGLIYFLFARQMRNAGKGALQFGKSRARMGQAFEKVTFADVAGITEAREEVEEIVDYLKAPERFQRLGGRIPRGVLIAGPPGTGKTLLARAIAGEADVPFFNISGSDFVEMFVGVGASRVRDMFEQGKKNSPCIIFIDEIDAVGRSRFSGLGGGHDEREQTLNALLVEMDGFEPNTSVIVIAATNRPDVLDSALLRPGRFDRQIMIDLPDLEGRRGILKVHSKKIHLHQDVDLNVVARGTPGFSGADLANLINEAALLAAHNKKDSVGMMELEEARDKVRFGRERRSRKVSDEDRKITAYHEAGHALLALYCEHTHPLHKITIIPRGNAYLGATMQLPEQDRYTQTRAELQDELTVLMGGRFAEKLIFNEITSGASADIRQATAIAHRMVCDWGMSEKMGMLNYGNREEHIYLGRDLVKTEDYSEETGRELDLEIRTLIDQAADRALTLLQEHRNQLELLGKTLLERETMTGEDVRLLLGLPKRTSVLSMNPAAPV